MKVPYSLSLQVRTHLKDSFLLSSHTGNVIGASTGEISVAAFDYSWCDYDILLLTGTSITVEINTQVPRTRKLVTTSCMLLCAYFGARRDSVCILCETIMSQCKTFKVPAFELWYSNQ